MDLWSSRASAVSPLPAADSGCVFCLPPRSEFAPPVSQVGVERQREGDADNRGNEANRGGRAKLQGRAWSVHPASRGPPSREQQVCGRPCGRARRPTGCFHERAELPRAGGEHRSQPCARPLGRDARRAELRRAQKQLGRELPTTWALAPTGPTTAFRGRAQRSSARTSTTTLSSETGSTTNSAGRSRKRPADTASTELERHSRECRTSAKTRQLRVKGVK